MGDTKPLSPADREDLVAYLDNEADPQATERVQNLLENNPSLERRRISSRKAGGFLTFSNDHTPARISRSARLNGGDGRLH